MIGSVRRWMHRKFTAEKNNAAPASQPDFTRMMRRTADATFVSGRAGTMATFRRSTAPHAAQLYAIHTCNLLARSRLLSHSADEFWMPFCHVSLYSVFGPFSVLFRVCPLYFLLTSKKNHSHVSFVSPRFSTSRIDTSLRPTAHVMKRGLARPQSAIIIVIPPLPVPIHSAPSRFFPGECCMRKR